MAFLVREPLLTGYFLFFSLLSVNATRSAVSKILRYITTQKHATLKSLKSPLFHIDILRTSEGCFDHFYISVSGIWWATCTWESFQWVQSREKNEINQRCQRNLWSPENNIAALFKTDTLNSCKQITPWIQEHFRKLSPLNKVHNWIHKLNLEVCLTKKIHVWTRFIHVFSGLQ